MESSIWRAHQSSSPEKRRREHGALPCPGDLGWRTSPEPPEGPGTLDSCSVKEVREQEEAECSPSPPPQARPQEGRGELELARRWNGLVISLGSDF